MANDLNKLRACPFCGGDDIAKHSSPERTLHWAKCDSCGTEGPTSETMPLAIEAWNRRQPDAGVVVPDTWFASVQYAYGYLWHVNAAVGAPGDCARPSVTAEVGTMKARKILYNLLDHHQRGDAISLVRAELPYTTPPASPVPASVDQRDQIIAIYEKAIGKLARQAFPAAMDARDKVAAIRSEKEPVPASVRDVTLTNEGKSVRAAILEEAAQACEAWRDEHSKHDRCSYSDCDFNAAATDCADAIRALASKEAVLEQRRDSTTRKAALQELVDQAQELDMGYGKDFKGGADAVDAERLTWLEKHCTGASDSERYLPFRIYWGDGRGIRKAIDAAIAAQGG